ncbi:MAG: ribonuclease HI family protein [Vicinamibacteria bacterium]
MSGERDRQAKLLRALAESLDVSKALATVPDAEEKELRSALSTAADALSAPSSARVYFDGASRGNPGPSGAGALIQDADGTILAEVAKYLGEFTNNMAEYLALSLALKEALRLGIRRVDLYSDSELLVKQINGEYRVKDEKLKLLNKSVRDVLSSFEFYEIRHIPREQNREADRLANRAIDDR